MQAVLVQVRGGVERPVSIACRKVTPAEQKMGQLKRKSVHVAWAVRQLKRYTAHAKKLKVVLPEPEIVLVVNHPDHHQRLAAILIELSMYNIKWAQGVDDWNLNDAFLDPTHLVNAKAEKGEELACPR